MHYRCTEWAPPPVTEANTHEAPAQERNDDRTRPLSLPPFLASLRVQQDDDTGDAAASPSIPQQRQVTKSDHDRVDRSNDNPLIDGRGGRRRMRGQLDVVERERSRTGSHVGWKMNASWYSFMVLKTFLRVSRTVTRP